MATNINIKKEMKQITIRLEKTVIICAIKVAEKESKKTGLPVTKSNILRRWLRQAIANDVHNNNQ